MTHDDLCEERNDPNFLRAECRCQERTLAARLAKAEAERDQYKAAFTTLDELKSRVDALLAEAEAAAKTWENEAERRSRRYEKAAARLAEAEAEIGRADYATRRAVERLAEAMRPKEVIIKGDRYQIEPCEDGTVNVRWLGVADSATHRENEHELQ